MLGTYQMHGGSHMRIPNVPDATTQHGMHTPSPVMNQNYTTNDRMLRYRRITQYFYGYLLCNKEGWYLVKREHMLPIICNR